MKPSEAETIQDLRELLTDFWLGAINDPTARFEHRVKASELLAKFILGEGPSPVKRRGPKRPPTAEILRLAQEFERDDPGWADPNVP